MVSPVSGGTAPTNQPMRVSPAGWSATVSGSGVGAAAQPQPLSPAARTAAIEGGLYLQLGAFSSDHAAQQLRHQAQGLVQTPVFVSPVTVDARTLHRVRVGPVESHDEAQQLVERLRLANLGTPALVSAN